MIVVQAVTGKKSDGRPEISCFLVPADSPGLVRKAMHGKMMWRSSNTAELYFDADAVRALGERVLLIASSDMNHYENDTITRVKDQKAIERILVMDARGLFDVVMHEDISMCGFGPTVAMLTAARRLGAVLSLIYGLWVAVFKPAVRRL